MLALLAMTAAAYAPARPPSPQPPIPRCEPVSDRDRVAAGATIDTGQYTLTVSATSGPSEGASARGSLWLRSTTAAFDSAAKAGAPWPAYSPDVPLYGATDADLVGASALPAAAATGSGVPGPRSFDPRRPGVLVWRHVNAARDDAEWRLYIATPANGSQRCIAEGDCDASARAGSGVVFDIHKVTASGFAGSWQLDAASRARGYFCAARLQYYSPYRSRNLAQPPRPH